MNSGPRRTVFVGSDLALDDVLEQIADALVARNIDVQRGPRATQTENPKYTPDRYAELFGRAEIVMVTTRVQVPPALLDAAPLLRGIVFPSIGTETLDVADATRRGLIVAHGPTPENFISMAEATVMLAVALMIELHAKERQLRQMLPRPRTLTSRMLSGKTLGLIGFGRIGRAVAERLAAWGVKLLVHDPHVDRGTVPDGISVVDLPYLLRESDVVSLHVIVNDTTRKMIGRAELRMMKPTSYLINTSRGTVVDQDALLEALRGKWIAGAALDTFQTEPLPASSALRELDNVILTNHSVGHTKDIYESLVPAAVENVTRILAGEPPLYPKNPEVLPAWRARVAAQVHSGGERP